MTTPYCLVAHLNLCSNCQLEDKLSMDRLSLMVKLWLVKPQRA